MISVRVVVMCAMLLAACESDTMEPREAMSPHPAPRREVAAIEITFYNIGRPDMYSTALVAPNVSDLMRMRAARKDAGLKDEDVPEDLTVPRRVDGSGNATIQLKYVGTYYLLP